MKAITKQLWVLGVAPFIVEKSATYLLTGKYGTFSAIPILIQLALFVVFMIWFAFAIYFVCRILFRKDGWISRFITWLFEDDPEIPEHVKSIFPPKQRFPIWRDK